MVKHLVIITATFPYGLKSETFLEHEIVEIAKYARKITILPTFADDGSGYAGARVIPSNVFVDNSLINTAKNQERNSIRRWVRIIEVLIFEIVKSKHRTKYFKYFKYFFNYLNKEIAYLDTLKHLFQQFEKPVIVYNYWFVKTNIAVSILRKKNVVSKVFSRAHGYDLYDDRWKYGVLPFRNFVAKGYDGIFPVSNYGKVYLTHSLYKGFDKEKIKTQYLGVPEQPLNPKHNKNDDGFNVVSVGSLLHFKRTFLIPRVLNNTGLKINWVHFGWGAEDQVNLLKESIAENEFNLNVTLKGHTSNADILRYYQDNAVDLFISLSVNEGVPVSIMEALSFGIPIVAVDIKAMKELVDSKVGILLDPSLSSIEIADQIKKVLFLLYDKAQIREYQRAKFNAVVNYYNFVTNLISRY